MFHRYAVAAGGALSLFVAGLVTLKVARRPKPDVLSAEALASGAIGEAGSPRAADGKVNSGPPTMLHLDARHTNRSPFAGPRAPKLLWTFDTGGPIQAAPIVLDNDTIVVASLGGKLYGLSDTGELRYQVDLGDRVYATPLAQSDALYVGSDAHKFFGLTKDGAVRFRLDADNDVDTGAVPAPWGGIVFASGRVVYASKPDGTLFWRLKTKRKCFSSPAVSDDGTVYVGSQDHHL